ncbi:MAG: response regulator [Halanaerobiales bacterium]|nr:response regulator [Halanaerobiales bacterium]
MSREAKCILIVDDEEMITESISTYLELTTDLCIYTANDPNKGLEIVRENQIDLVISDFLMPSMNGLEFLREVKKIHKDATLILLTGYADKENAIKAINEIGLYFYIEKPWNNQELVKIVYNGLEKKTLVDDLREKITELKVSKDEIDRLYSLLKEEYEQEKENIENVIISLARAIEAKDKYTEGHIERVKELAVKMGQRLNFNPEQLKVLETAALIHDIGKIGIPEKILNKPDKLTAEEFEVIKSHSVIGEEICQPLNSLGKTRPIVRSHHEKLDGSGYPDGLKADQISLEVRIVTVVDIFDALYSERPYRAKLPIEECIRILQEEVADNKLDGEVVNLLIELIRKGEIGI